MRITTRRHDGENQYQKQVSQSDREQLPLTVRNVRAPTVRMTARLEFYRVNFDALSLSSFSAFDRSENILQIPSFDGELMAGSHSSCAPGHECM